MQSSETKNSKASRNNGIIYIIVGLLGLIFVHSKRPPSGLGDIIMMMGQPDSWFISEPIYQILMLGFFALAAYGGYMIYKVKKASESNVIGPGPSSNEPPKEND